MVLEPWPPGERLCWPDDGGERMVDAIPKHRRERPGRQAVRVLLFVAAFLVAWAVWGVSTLFASGDAPSAKRPAAGEPVEQAETPGEPVGAATGPYQLWIARIGVRAEVVEIVSDDDRELLPPEDPLLAG